jgi:hypothetical protein
MRTIAELPEFIRTADKLLSESERQDIIRYLSEHTQRNELAGLVKILVQIWKRKPT